MFSSLLLEILFLIISKIISKKKYLYYIKTLKADICEILKCNITIFEQHYFYVYRLMRLKLNHFDQGKY